MSYHNPTAAHVDRAHYRIRRGRLGSNPPQLIAPELGARIGRLGLVEQNSLGGAGRLVAPQLGAAAPKQTDAQRKKKVLDEAKAQNTKAKNASPPSAEWQKLKDHKLTPGRDTLQSSWWSEANKTAAKITKVFEPVTKHLPTPGPLLATRPLDAMLDIFDPIEIHIGSAIDRVLARKGNTQNFFGIYVNCQRVQENDWKCDVSTRNILKRLRTIEAWIVLWFTHPIDLAAEMIVEGFNIAKVAANAVADTVEKVAKAAGDAAKAAGKKADKVAKAANDAKDYAVDKAKDVASSFGIGAYGIGGHYDGVGFTGAEETAAASPIIAEEGGKVAVTTTVEAGPPIVVVLQKVLPELLKAGIESGSKEGAKVAVQMIKSSAKVPTKGAHVTGPVTSTPQANTGNSVVPVMVVGGAALLAFLFLRSKGRA